MARTWEDHGIILRTWPVSEIHTGLIILCKQRGLVQAIAHGARSARGSLKSQVQVMNLGLMGFYEDPVKKSIKLREVQVLEDFQKVKADLAKYLESCVWLELLAKVAVEGAWEYELLSEALGSLGNLPTSFVHAVAVQFAVRFLANSGIAADPLIDAQTDRAFTPADGVELSGQAGGFVLSHNPQKVLDAGTRAYLVASLNVSFERGAQIGLNSDQRLRLKTQLFDSIQEHYNLNLPTRLLLP